MKYKYIRYLPCPIICLILGVLSYYFMLSGLKITNNVEVETDHFKPALIRDKVIARIDGYIYKYQKGYWFTWIVIYGNKYYFVDVRGYNPHADSGDKIFSVKYKGLNPWYLTDHKLDINSHYWLNSLDTGLVGYYSSIEDLKSYESVYESLRAANLDIEAIGLSVTKDSKENTIYVFIITETEQGDKRFSKQDISNTLSNIALYAKTQL